MATGGKDVFISHHSKDEEHLHKMKELLEKKGYSIRNSSITSDKPNNASSENYIKTMLSSRIRWASVCVVLVGPETHSREWVEWEIEYAHKHGKRIVGVYCHGGTEADVPEALNKYGAALVPWNADGIMKAISGETNRWCDPSGSDRDPVFDIKRIVCQ